MKKFLMCSAYTHLAPETAQAGRMHARLCVYLIVCRDDESGCLTATRPRSSLIPSGDRKCRRLVRAPVAVPLLPLASTHPSVSVAGEE